MLLVAVEWWPHSPGSPAHLLALVHGLCSEWIAMATREHNTLEVTRTGHHRRRAGNSPALQPGMVVNMRTCLATCVLCGCCQPHSVSVLQGAACPACARLRCIVVGCVVCLSATIHCCNRAVDSTAARRLLADSVCAVSVVAGLCPEGLGRQGRQCCSRPSCIPGTCSCQQCCCKGHTGSTSQQLNLWRQH